MKEKILKLRNEGKNYREIVDILGCAKSTVSYHCNETTKDLSNIKQQIRRKKGVIKTKLQRFLSRTLSEKARSFQRRKGGRLIPRIEYNFTLEQVKEKIGEIPTCYLSGQSIDLMNGKSYNFDHIIPPTKGGNNSLENLGILTSEINWMKRDLTPDEFIDICKKILIHQGYTVVKGEPPGQ